MVCRLYFALPKCTIGRFTEDNDSTNNGISFAPSLETECAIFRFLSSLTLDFSNMLHVSIKKFRMFHIRAAFTRQCSDVNNDESNCSGALNSGCDANEVLRRCRFSVATFVDSDKQQQQQHALHIPSSFETARIHSHRIHIEQCSISNERHETHCIINGKNIVVSFAKHTIR